MLAHEGEGIGKGRQGFAIPSRLPNRKRVAIQQVMSNLAASSALDGFVDAQHHWLVPWNKQTHQQPQQQATKIN